jgi:hypothetical protein
MNLGSGMAGDKRKKRRTLPPLPRPVQGWVRVAVYSFADLLPGTAPERASAMLTALDGALDGLHRSGYAAPRWLVDLRWFYWRAVDMGASRATPGGEYLRKLLAETLAGMQEEERTDAIAALSCFLAALYRENGVRLPDWLRDLSGEA